MPERAGEPVYLQSDVPVPGLAQLSTGAPERLRCRATHRPTRNTCNVNRQAHDKRHLYRDLRLSRRTLILGSAAGLALSVSGCGSDEPEEPVSHPDYPNDTIFASPAWVAGRLQSGNLRILDCSDLSTYRRGHLPAARHVWWQDTIEIHNPVYGMLVNAGNRSAFARNACISPASEVVCYDDAGGTYAARVAWTLRYMGFRNTRIMPGGTRAWRAGGHDLTLQEPNCSGEGVADIFDESIVAHPQDILARMDESHLVLLDTRTVSERQETWHGRLRHGSIPGSHWLSRDEFLDDRSIPLDANRLVDRLGGLVDLAGTAEVIVYGLHGTLAALPYYQLLALDRFHVRLYDGSWSQWGADEAFPVEPL
jgi:thiosulfate/3-mercaptopyruvate sulfurtransferase